MLKLHAEQCTYIIRQRLFLTVRLYYFSDTDANKNADKYSGMENKLLA